MNFGKEFAHVACLDREKAEQESSPTPTHRGHLRRYLESEMTEKAWEMIAGRLADRAKSGEIDILEYIFGILETEE